MTNSDKQGDIRTEVSALPPVVDNIFTASADDPGQFELIGSHCAACDRYFFPGAEFCSDCHATADQVSLGGRGTIYSYTVVRIKPPLGLPQPYAVAYIDLLSVPLRIFCLLDPEQAEEAAIGGKVVLSVGAVGQNNAGQACLRPFFQLLDDNASI